MIFVFGSNLAGLHGAGAAKFAEQHRGAIRGVGVGLQNNSYAIPTKDHQIRTLPLYVVKQHIMEFLSFAKHHYDMEYFQVTCIGCGLAGFKNEQIAPLFADAPDNCKFDEAWKPWLGNTTPTGSPRPYWGTF
jgi:hypothetical protein